MYAFWNKNDYYGFTNCGIVENSFQWEQKLGIL